MLPNGPLRVLFKRFVGLRRARIRSAALPGGSILSSIFLSFRHNLFPISRRVSVHADLQRGNANKRPNLVFCQVQADLSSICGFLTQEPFTSACRRDFLFRTFRTGVRCVKGCSGLAQRPHRTTIGTGLIWFSPTECKQHEQFLGIGSFRRDWFSSKKVSGARLHHSSRDQQMSFLDKN